MKRGKEEKQSSDDDDEVTDGKNGQTRVEPLLTLLYSNQRAYSALIVQTAEELGEPNFAHECG